MTSYLLDSIIPFWYKTVWSFEGHSEVPQQGEIACGYFVSTTLLHAGLKLNRYKMAQQDPFTQAHSLRGSTRFLQWRNTSAEETVEEFMKPAHPEGLYFVGLDNHVGYLYKTGSQLYFIHSTYLLRLGVTIECAADSYAFNSSNYFITPISEDKSLVKKWLLGEEVKVQLVQ